MRGLGAPADHGLGLSPRRLVRNSVSGALGSGVSLAAGAVSGLLVARALGPDGFGAFSVVWTLAWGAAIFVPLGFETLVVRELNRREPLVDLRRAIPSVTVASAAVGLGAVALGSLLGIDRTLLAALGAGGLYIVASGPLAVLEGSFQGRERMELAAATRTIEGAATLAGVAGVIATGGGLVAVSIALAAGRAAALLAAVMLHRRSPGSGAAPVRERSLRELLPISLPMWLSRLTMEAVRRVDILILGLFVAADEVGTYAAAAAIAIYAPTLLLELNKALYPVLSRAPSAEDGDLLRVVESTWALQLVAGVSAAAGLVALRGPLVEFLYGAVYTRAAGLLLVLAWVVPLRVLGSLCAVTLDATERQRRRARAGVVAVVANVVLNLVLIPRVGILGAAIATVVTDGLLLGVLVAGARPFRPPVRSPLVQAAAVAVPVAIVAAAAPGHVLLRVAAGSATFVVLAVVVTRAAVASHVARWSRP